MTVGTMPRDVVPLLEGNHRARVIFTISHSGEAWQGAEEFDRNHSGLDLPWPQVQLAATTGLDRELLTFRGRVIPAAIALAHEVERDALRHTCPKALPTAVVTGDICLVRMLGSPRFRSEHRRTLSTHELITISSTWSPESTFGHHPDLDSRLLDEIPADGLRVAAVLHPNIWTVHGPWPVNAWSAAARRRRLIVISPEQGSQARARARQLNELAGYGTTDGGAQ